MSDGSIYYNASSKISGAGDDEDIVRNGEEYLSMQEDLSLTEDMVVDFDCDENSILRKVLESDGLQKEYCEIIDIGDIDDFNDFQDKLKNENIKLSFHQNDGYKFNETNKTIYLRFNKLCLKLDKQNINNYNICNIDDNIVITNNKNSNIFEINKTQVKIYNKNNHLCDNNGNINGYEYVYDIKDNRLFFRNDNLDSLELYEYKVFSGGEKCFYPQKNGYLGNFRRTWEKKQQPMNLLQALVGINQQQKPESDDKKNNNYKTCLCSVNCCSGDDVDVVTDDIASLKNNPNVGTTITGRTYNTLSLEDANKKIANNNQK